MSDNLRQRRRKQRIYQQKRKAKAAAKGLCNICVKRPARKGLKTCYTCSRKKAAWLRAARRRKAAERSRGLAHWLGCVYRAARTAARASWRAAKRHADGRHDQDQ